MELKSKELKRRARENLNGKYGLPMGAFVVTELIVLCITSPFNFALQRNPSVSQAIIFYLASFIISLLTIILSCGLLQIHLNLARGKDSKFTDLFMFFRKRPDRYILAQLLLIGIIILIMIPFIAFAVCAILFESMLWLILMAVVGVLTIVFLFIVSFSYSQIYCIMVDQPDLGIIAAYRKSREIMQGNKGRLFYISLSFIGLSLLCLLSFGIGFLWVSPYMTQTNVEFYRNIIGEV